MVVWLTVATSSTADEADPPPAPVAEAAEPTLWDVVSHSLSEPLVLAFLIIGIGMAIGSIRLFGLSLGSSGVLFAALAFGHFGKSEGWTMPEGLGTLGLVLFVYAVGLAAGPTFFRAFRDQGKQFAFLGMITVSLGAITIAICAWWFELPGDLAVGIFSGALTSTPALAAGTEAAQETGKNALAVSIGYGMVYPVGVISVVLFVQLLPRLLRVNFDRITRDAEKNGDQADKIGRHLVRITNPAVFGKTLHDVALLDQVGGQITRVLDGEQLVPIKPGHVFEQDQVVLVVTDGTTAEMLTMLLGKTSDVRVMMDSDRDRSDLVVSSPDMLNKPLRDLHLRSRFGVTISRVERYGVGFVPDPGVCFNMGDRIRAVGDPEGLQAFTKAVGHAERKLHETDLMSVGLGLVVGILIGMIPISIPSLGQFSLGMAGGPLLAGLLFAHSGRLMGIVGYMPRAARMLTQELGLAMFLASAGFLAGGYFVEMLQQYGIEPFLIGLAAAVIPLAAGFAIARYVLRLDFLQSLGGICGSMTSTAGIGAIVNRTDLDVPVISYAAAYPAALVMMTIIAQILLAVIG